MNSPFSAVRVRRMTPADLDSVIEIAESLKEAPHWPRSAYLAAVGPADARRRIALVAEDAAPSDRPSPLRRLVGFAVASLLAPQAELESIAVARVAQRHGLARRLLAELAAELARAEITEILLEARASNSPALGLYRQSGFAETGRRPRYYRDPVEDAVLMRLEL
jgi:ribosomal-protein-alanine N-acetyltransferase